MTVPIPALPPWPAWLPGGTSLRIAALTDLKRLFDVVLPTPRPTSVPVAIEQAPTVDGVRAFVGSASLWDSDRARFGISADAGDHATAAWVAKPMVLATGIALPGVTVDELWMILTAAVPATPWTLPGGDAMLPMVRHLVGVVRIGGRRTLLRLDVRGTEMTAEVDFDGALTPVERAALGRDPGVQPGLHFTDLVELFGNDHDPAEDLRWLPETLRATDAFALDELHLSIDGSGLTGIGAAVSIDTASWPLVPGFSALTVDGIRVAFDVDHPLDPASRSPRVAVEGDVTIGSAKLTLGARWPDLAVNAHLAEGTILLSEMLAAAHLPAFGAHPGPGITELVLDARPQATPSTFALHARVENLPSVALGGVPLALTDLEFDVALSRGEDTGRTVDVDVRGTLAIGTGNLILRAACDHGTDGWTLQAELLGPGPSLEDIQDWLTGNYGAPALPGVVMGPNATIDRLAVEVDTASHDATLQIGTQLHLGDVDGELELDVTLAHQGGGGWAGAVAGSFTVKKHAFDLVVARDGDAAAPSVAAPSVAAPSVAVAAYRNSGATVGDLLAAFGIAGLPIPVVLSDALVAFAGDQRLALVDVGTGFDLSQIPIIGRMLPAHERIAVDLRFVAASGSWTADLAGELSKHMPTGYAPLAGTPSGVDVIVALTLGDTTHHFQQDLGVAVDPAKIPSAAPGSLPVQQNGGDTAPTWVDVQRALGPIHLRRAGMRFGSGEIELLLDGELALGGFTLDLLGLSITTPLDTFTPTVGFTGLGLDLRQGDLELAGSFLRTDDGFAGAALLRAGQLALSAIGAYGTIKGSGQPSLFVYAVLDYPLGGPAFFFVTGFAAGFGYNRRILPPTIDKVTDFPLVHEASSGAAAPKPADLLTKLQSFEAVLPESQGDLFAAAGIKFTSFKTIDSFALLIVSIGSAPGSRLRIDLLGTSTLIAPAPLPGAAAVPPVAEIHMGFRAQFAPEEGFIGAEAQLTAASYVLSDKCHVMGGAAFYSWLLGEHAGDFVVTVGGYHPAFVAPPHYPVVPRLGMLWKVTDELMVKGDLYYALTGHAIMAGGHLEAVYESGAVGASFRLGIDMLATWQPFSYDARAYVDVAVHWHALHFELGVDVHVWGPEFAGVAVIDLSVASFTVAFGKDRTDPPALSWKEFRGASLPPAACAIACTRGLVGQVPTTAGFAAEWVVSAHDLVLTVSSRVPSTAILVSPDGIHSTELVTGRQVGVAPMHVAEGGMAAPLTYTVTPTVAGHEFRVTPVLAPVPAALWGDPPPAPEPGGRRTPEANAPRHVEHALTGFELRPPARTRSKETGFVAVDDALFKDLAPRPAAERARLTLVEWSDSMPDPADIAADRAEVLIGFGVEPGAFRPGPPDPFRLAPHPVSLHAKGLP